MSHLVYQLGRWVDLCPDTKEQYLCAHCKMPVSPGNDGHAISHPHNEWSYVHYHNCVPDTPAKKGRNKRVKRNEHKD